MKKKQEEELDRIRAVQNADITAEGVRVGRASRAAAGLCLAGDTQRG
jgi:hypothetical protein